MLALLGGYLNRKSDLAPGVKTMWFGFRNLHEHKNFSKEYIYLITAEILRKRLKFLGFSRENLELEFQTIMDEEAKRCKEIFEKNPENPSEDFLYLQKILPTIVNSNLDQWLVALKIIFQNNLHYNNWIDKEKLAMQTFDNPLVDFYLNGAAFDPEDFDLCLPFKIQDH